MQLREALRVARELDAILEAEGPRAVASARLRVELADQPRLLSQCVVCDRCDAGRGGYCHRCR